MVRVAVATAYRAYTEALIGALQQLSPDADVRILSDADLDRPRADWKPDLVIASEERSSPIPCAWITLYPEGRNIGVIDRDGVRRVIPCIAFQDILAVVNELAAHELLGQSGG